MIMKLDLNAVSSEYRPNAATSLENHLILNWYPHRILERTGHVGSLLELGLGHGHTARLFSESSDRYVVVDGSSVVIDLFHEQTPNFRGEVVEAYFEDYTPNTTFDVIVMGFILEHVQDPALVLARYRQYLKPDGKLFVTVPNAKSMNRRLGLEMGLIDDIYSLNANDIAMGHLRQYCRDTLGKEVRDAGYRIAHEEGIYLKPLPLSVLQTLPDRDANLHAMLKVGIEFPDLCVALMMELDPA